MRDLTILFVFLISIASGTPAEAAEDIQMVEQYFDALTTMEADFTQINEDSSISSGIFYLQRPGKFRLDYTDPDSLLVVTQGNDLVTYDSYSDDVTY
ncbi:MAG: LolA family protein, partial [Alphaproteobacteria bacterium]